jgi:tetratricopeptide (TPR) repeat protein
MAGRDKAAANAVFTNAIAKVPENQRTIGLYISHAEFLLNQGFGDEAIAAAEQGRPFQTKGVQEIDRWQSNVYTQFSQTADMVRASKQVVAGGADTKDMLYQKRVVEGLVQLGKFDEAAAELSKLPTGDAMDIDTMLIAAAVKEGQKDVEGERALLNRAVARGGNMPMPFLRRGRFFLRTGNERDALADLTKAVELAPTNPVYLRERARMHMQRKDTNAMFADLKAAARVAPQDAQSMFALLQELQTAGRDREAEELASELQGLRKTDASFANQLAGFFRSIGNYDVAREFSRKAFELDETDFYAQQYLDVLLDGPSPNLGEVERVLTQLADRVTGNPGFMMARAKQRAAQNKKPDAQRLAQDVAKLLNADSPEQFSAWYNDFRKIVDKDTDRFAALDQFARAGIAPDWMTFFRASEQLANQATRAQAVKDLNTLASVTKREATKYFVAKQLGGTHFQANEFEAAAAAWKAGLVVQPDDVEMLNNLAYTYVKHLGKAAEGLPLAEKAHQLNPTSADIADTLGLAKFETGAVDEAIKLFEQSRAGARNVNTLVQASIHLADAHLKKGDKAAAKLVLQQLDQATAQTAPEALAATKTELDGLRSRVEAP